MSPETPSAPEIGLPDFIASAWFAFVAPPWTPNAVVQQINAAADEAFRMPDVQKRYLGQGAEPVGKTTAEKAVLVREEMGRCKHAIQPRHVHLE